MTTTKIDDIGDLTLIVGPDKDRFQVSSIALRHASLVWRAMLAGPFQEASATEITFEEDDPEALKYDTTSWVNAYMKNMLSSCTSLNSDDKLWVYWVFGDEAWFKSHCEKIWRDVSVDKNGDCLVKDQLILKGNMPSAVMEPVLKARIVAIEAIFKSVAKLWDISQTGSESCVQSHGRKSCSLFQLGVILTIMQGLGRSTAEWSAADIRGSFNEVVKIITDVKPQNDFCMDRHGRSNHETCDYQKKVLCEVAKASNTFRNMPAVDSYDRHFAAFL